MWYRPPSSQGDLIGASHASGQAQGRGGDGHPTIGITPSTKQTSDRLQGSLEPPGWIGDKWMLRRKDGGLLLSTKVEFLPHKEKQGRRGLLAAGRGQTNPLPTARHTRWTSQGSPGWDRRRRVTYGRTAGYGQARER